MKNTFIATLIVLMANLSYSQSTAVNWADVKVYEFESEGAYPDSLEICGGEWFLKTKARTMKELSQKDLKAIKQQVAQFGCDVVYVDGKMFYTLRPNQMYYLGLKKKED